MSATYVDRPFPTGNVYEDSLLWGGDSWRTVGSARTTITYFIADSPLASWTGVEMMALRAALRTWSDVANVSFQEVATAGAANFVEHVVSDERMRQLTGATSVLGFHETPNRSNQVDGYFNDEGLGWDRTTASGGGLQPGGEGFVTLVHELGHGLGLAHPHDHGGGSRIFPGVTSAFDSFGDHDLNQGIFTVMSYNDGWTKVQDPLGHGITTYGLAAGPMAFDVAAVQELYGANTTFHTRDDTYLLPDGSAPGNDWSCLWDAGGSDQIVYNGAKDTTISLIAATIDDSSTGGGVPTYAHGAYGGFTIAQGVTIENAVGGSGHDRITGNEADNRLSGRDGDDTLKGEEGSDLLKGGSGDDRLVAGGGDDRLIAGAGNDDLNGGQGDDTFVFRAGFGHDTVAHFRAGDSGGDVIDLRPLFVSFDEVMAHAAQSGADTIITYDAADTIVLRDIQLAALNAGDFHFA